MVLPMHPQSPLPPAECKNGAAADNLNRTGVPEDRDSGQSIYSFCGKRQCQ
nr:MAG TPA: hypothetical protein [Caudoviricetes sp.]